ncbi:Uncharacterised protein [Salmonella enterica subsp. enterica]|nr:Uncharacterised protein [Salmonella enterica subsp. enterica]
MQAPIFLRRFLIHKKKKIRPTIRTISARSGQKIPCQCTDSGRKPTPWIMPAQTAHISNNPCQISSVLVLAANRDGSQNIHPASTIAITKESALNGRLSHYRINILHPLSCLFVGCGCTPQSLTDVSSWGFAALPPRCNLNDFVYCIATI